MLVSRCSHWGVAGARRPAPGTTPRTPRGNEPAASSPTSTGNYSPHPTRKRTCGELADQHRELLPAPHEESNQRQAPRPAPGSSPRTPRGIKKMPAPAPTAVRIGAGRAFRCESKRGADAPRVSNDRLRLQNTLAALGEDVRVACKLRVCGVQNEQPVARRARRPRSSCLPSALGVGTCCVGEHNTTRCPRTTRSPRTTCSPRPHGPPAAPLVESQTTV